MKAIAFLLVALLFAGAPSTVDKAMEEKTKKLNSYYSGALNLIDLWAKGRAESAEVDAALLRVINEKVPKKLEFYKLTILRWLFQYEFAKEMEKSDPYTAAIMLGYIKTKLLVYSTLLDAYLQGLNQQGGRR